MDFSNVSDAELLAMLEQAEQGKNRQNTMQAAYKVLANSLYGALGCSYFRFYDVDLATAITLSGQVAINTVEKNVNEYGIKLANGGEPLIRVIGGDTDSVVGSSIIIVDGKETTIADYHESLTEIESVYVDGGDVRRGVGSGLSFNRDDFESEYGKILYSMKHKVKKKMYRIHVGNSYVDVTEDHSVEIYDHESDSVCGCKPTLIRDYDLGIDQRGNLHTIKVECLGETDDYVYDIEVDGNHNFFANGILVHNSNYVDFTGLMKKLGDQPTEKLVDALDKFAGEKVQGVITNCIKNLCADTNAYANHLYMKRESIAKAIFVAKKKYVMIVYDNEGVRYATPELKVTGLEAIKSSTPAWVRKRLTDAYMMFFNNTESDLQKFVKTVRNDYNQAELRDIVAASTANNISKYIVNDVPIMGAPFQIKASHVYNQMLVKKKLTGKYPMIQSGDKVKLANLKMPNPTKAKLIAFSDKIPAEFGIEQFVDRDFMFDKFFLSPLQRVASVVQWDTERKFKL